MTMDARKQRVLQAIVALYGLEGEPVGSSVLANYFDMAVSSATLRNEMAALTKLGLLEQPHTSAGRVPSAKGYRYYLDNLLTDDQPLDRVTRARVDAVFASLDHEPEKLAQGAAKALAALAGEDIPTYAEQMFEAGADLTGRDAEDVFDEAADCGFKSGAEHAGGVLGGGRFAIFFPGELHKPSCKSEGCDHVRKAVVKILMR